MEKLAGLLFIIALVAGITGLALAQQTAFNQSWSAFGFGINAAHGQIRGGQVLAVSCAKSEAQ